MLPILQLVQCRGTTSIVGTAAEAGQAEEVRKAQKSGQCQLCDTIHMNVRKKECRTCGAPRKDRTTYQNRTREWSTKWSNAKKTQTASCGVSSKPSQTRSRQQPRIQPHCNVGTRTKPTQARTLKTHHHKNHSDTVPTSANTQQTALKRRNQILSDIKKYESMSFQEGSPRGLWRSSERSWSRLQQDLPQPLPRKHLRQEGTGQRTRSCRS